MAGGQVTPVSWRKPNATANSASRPPAKSMFNASLPNIPTGLAASPAPSLSSPNIARRDNRAPATELTSRFRAVASRAAKATSVASAFSISASSNAEANKKAAEKRVQSTLRTLLSVGIPKSELHKFQDLAVFVSGRKARPHMCLPGSFDSNMKSKAIKLKPLLGTASASMTVPVSHLHVSAAMFCCNSMPGIAVKSLAAWLRQKGPSLVDFVCPNDIRGPDSTKQSIVSQKLDSALSRQLKGEEPCSDEEMVRNFLAAMSLPWRKQLSLHSQKASWAMMNTPGFKQKLVLAMQSTEKTSADTVPNFFPAAGQSDGKKLSDGNAPVIPMIGLSSPTLTSQTDQPGLLNMSTDLDSLLHWVLHASQTRLGLVSTHSSDIQAGKVPHIATELPAEYFGPGSVLFNPDVRSVVIHCETEDTVQFLLSTESPSIVLGPSTSIGMRIPPIIAPHKTVPAPIYALDVLEITSDCVHICWQPPQSDGGSAIMEYVVCFTKSPVAPRASLWEQLKPPNRLQDASDAHSHRHKSTTGVVSRKDPAWLIEAERWDQLACKHFRSAYNVHVPGGAGGMSRVHSAGRQEGLQETMHTDHCEFVIDGLLPGQWIHDVCVRACNSVGSSSPISLPSVRSLPETIPPGVTSLSIRICPGSRSSILVSWDPDVDNDDSFFDMKIVLVVRLAHALEGHQIPAHDDVGLRPGHVDEHHARYEARVTMSSPLATCVAEAKDNSQGMARIYGLPLGCVILAAAAVRHSSPNTSASEVFGDACTWWLTDLAATMATSMEQASAYVTFPMVVPPPPPADIMVEDVLHNQVAISCSIAPDDGGSRVESVIFEATLNQNRVIEASSAVVDPAMALVGPDSTAQTSNIRSIFVVFENLQAADILSNVRARCINSAGQGPFSLPLKNEIQTPEMTVPSSPTNVVISSVGSGSITIEWSQPQSDGGSPLKEYIAHYIVSVQSADGNDQTTNGMKSVNHPVAMCVIDGLPCNSRIWGVTVSAVNEAGVSEPSNPPCHCVTQSQNISGPPRKLSVDTWSSFGMDVSWQNPLDTGGLPVLAWAVLFHVRPPWLGLPTTSDSESGSSAMLSRNSATRQIIHTPKNHDLKQQWKASSPIAACVSKSDKNGTVSLGGHAVENPHGVDLDAFVPASMCPMLSMDDDMSLQGAVCAALEHIGSTKMIKNIPSVAEYSLEQLLLLINENAWPTFAYNELHEGDLFVEEPEQKNDLSAGLDLLHIQASSLKGEIDMEVVDISNPLAPFQSISESNRSSSEQIVADSELDEALKQSRDDDMQGQGGISISNSALPHTNLEKIADEEIEERKIWREALSAQGIGFDNNAGVAEVALNGAQLTGMRALCREGIANIEKSSSLNFDLNELQSLDFISAESMPVTLLKLFAALHANDGASDTSHPVCLILPPECTSLRVSGLPPQCWILGMHTVAINSAGIGQTSHPQVCTRSMGVFPPHQPSNVSVEALSGTCIKILFDLEHDSNQDLPILDFKVSWTEASYSRGTSVFAETKKSVVVPAASSSEIDGSLLLSDISPSSYVSGLRLAARNAHSTGKLSGAAKDCLMPSISTPDRVNAFEVTGVSACEISVSWEHPISDGGSSISEYMISFVCLARENQFSEMIDSTQSLFGSILGQDPTKKVKSQHEKWASITPKPQTVTASSDQRQASFQVSPGSIVQNITICAMNALGKGPKTTARIPSSVLTIAKGLIHVPHITPCSAPRNVTVMSSARQSLRFSWESPAFNGGSEVIGYIAQIKLSQDLAGNAERTQKGKRAFKALLRDLKGTIPDDRTIVVGFHAWSRSALVTGLPAGERIEDIRLSAVNGDGLGLWSIPQKCQIPGFSTPGIVQNVEAVSPTKGLVVVKWSPPEFEMEPNHDWQNAVMETVDTELVDHPLFEYQVFFSTSASNATASHAGISLPLFRSRSFGLSDVDNWPGKQSSSVQQYPPHWPKVPLPIASATSVCTILHGSSETTTNEIQISAPGLANKMVFDVMIRAKLGASIGNFSIPVCVMCKGADLPGIPVLSPLAVVERGGAPKLAVRWLSPKQNGGAQIVDIQLRVIVSYPDVSDWSASRGKILSDFEDCLKQLEVIGKQQDSERQSKSMASKVYPGQLFRFIIDIPVEFASLMVPVHPAFVEEVSIRCRNTIGWSPWSPPAKRPHPRRKANVRRMGRLENELHGAQENSEAAELHEESQTGNHLQPLHMSDYDDGTVKSASDAWELESRGTAERLAKPKAAEDDPAPAGGTVVIHPSEPVKVPAHSSGAKAQEQQFKNGRETQYISDSDENEFASNSQLVKPHKDVIALKKSTQSDGNQEPWNGLDVTKEDAPNTSQTRSSGLADNVFYVELQDIPASVTMTSLFENVVAACPNIVRLIVSVETGSRNGQIECACAATTDVAEASSLMSRPPPLNKAGDRPKWSAAKPHIPDKSESGTRALCSECSWLCARLPNGGGFAVDFALSEDCDDVDAKDLGRTSGRVQAGWAVCRATADGGMEFACIMTNWGSHVLVADFTDAAEASVDSNDSAAMRQKVMLEPETDHPH